jgi:gliding motility-associated-like protein
MDPSNGCQSGVPLIILLDTFPPKVVASMITQTLTCYNPTVLATGTSTTPNAVISWIVPSTPPAIPQSTIIVGPPTGPATSTMALTYANYTIVATNTVNACKTTSVVAINQNFRAPLPLISIGNPSVINCNGQPAILNFTNVAVTSSVVGAFAQVMQWSGPAPQVSLATVAQYSAVVPGTYTLVVRDSYNGCYGSITYTVIDRTQPPVLSHTPSLILDCGASKVTFTPVVIGGSAGHSFVFFDYPAGTSFSPLSAVVLPGTYSTNVSVDMPGTYSFVVTNTLTGCEAHGSFEVINGGITADFIPTPSVGFAPLNVTMTNNSSTSLSTGSIISLWSYGNGASQTTSANISTSATYTAPGTYTVMLLVNKGVCVDTMYKIINVEIPSALNIPNVFTPNGDGSNDVFFLKTAGLGEIHALIYDRWGNRIYEVTSNTGNIAWDGKSIDGKDCADGTYFYIITAKGKDAKEYSQTGNVSLYR